MKHHEKSATQKKCNMKGTQHEERKGAKRENWNMIECNKKKCNMDIMQLDQSATQKECNMMEKAQREKKQQHGSSNKNKIWRKKVHKIVH